MGVELAFWYCYNIDASGLVYYISECDIHCVAVFTSEGRLERYFDGEGEGP